MIIENNCDFGFRRYKSLISLLGFHNKLYASGVNASENMANILTIKSSRGMPVVEYKRDYDWF